MEPRQYPFLNYSQWFRVKRKISVISNNKSNIKSSNYIKNNEIYLIVFVCVTQPGKTYKNETYMPSAYIVMATLKIKRENCLIERIIPQLSRCSWNTTFKRKKFMINLYSHGNYKIMNLLRKTTCQQNLWKEVIKVHLPLKKTILLKIHLLKKLQNPAIKVRIWRTLNKYLQTLYSKHKRRRLILWWNCWGWRNLNYWKTK